MRTWFNRHFASVARVVTELRRASPPLPLEILVSHRHAWFPGYAVADEAFLEPAGLSADSYLDWVLETIRTRRVECLVPGHEQSFLTSHAAALAAAGCTVFEAAPAEALPGIHCKDLVYGEVADLVDIPLHAVCRSPFEARSLVAEIESEPGREACLKPCVSVYGKGFTRITADPRRAASWRPLVDAWARGQAAATRFAPHLVLEYLPGHEYSVDVAARRGVLLDAVVRRKPLATGGQLIADRPDLLAATARLVSRYGLNGLINVQFKEDREGRPRLLEINPRASGGIGMSCAAGVNLPAISFRGFLEPDWQPPAGRPRLGVRIVEIPQAFTCPAADPLSAAWRDPDHDGGERPDTTTVELPTGTLTLTVDDMHATSLGELIGFGARANPRRGFVFVSKLLGKHWPSRPHDMSILHRQLAERVSRLPCIGRGVRVVVGMAETATGLGRGVHESLLDILGGEPAGVAVQSTRHLRGDGDVLRFEEPHSHGPSLAVELPTSEPLRGLFHAAETLVVCDDEVSSGATLANLVAAAGTLLPRLRHVVVVAIADFSGGSCRELLASVVGVESVHVISLVSGTFAFAWRAGALPPPIEPRGTSSEGRKAVVDADSPSSEDRCSVGRFELPDGFIDACLRQLGRTAPPILVVGTGEFMHPAFRLAIELEARGLECRVQSTTRSPLLVAADIRSATAVPDLTAAEVPHFLYNYDRRLYGGVVVVHDSPLRPQVDGLCGILAGPATCLEADLLRGRAWLHAPGSATRRPQPLSGTGSRP